MSLPADQSGPAHARQIALLDELLLGQSRFLQGVAQCLYLIWGHPDVHRVLGVLLLEDSGNLVHLVPGLAVGAPRRVFSARPVLNRLSHSDVSCRSPSWGFWKYWASVLAHVPRSSRCSLTSSQLRSSKLLQ